MRKLSKAKVLEVANKFTFEGDVIDCLDEHSGHLNNTYHIVTTKGKYILQRLNGDVFKDPEAVMSNIRGVSDVLISKIKERGGDPSRECLVLIPVKNNGNTYIDDAGDRWRAYIEVKNSRTILYAENADIVYEAGKVLGRFERDLSDYPADKLKETIPHFHDTESRYNDFIKAVNDDKAGRLANVKEAVEETIGYKDYAKPYGKLSLHVTHNDPKIPNILYEKDEDKALCLIDFDTIMPGYLPDDVGDALRSAAAKSDEDEPDLSKVGVNVEFFKAFMKGYLSEAKTFVDEDTKKNLVYGYLKMTYELVLRFMGDYLNGDTYFAIAYPEHNKVRALCQLALFKDILKHRDELETFVKENA